MNLEYITSTVSMHDGDGIDAHVLNHSPDKGIARVHIYKNAGAGAVEVSDTSGTDVVAT